MNIVNRDMSIEEKNKLQKSKKGLNDLLSDLKNGIVKKEDLPQETIEELRNFLDL